MVFRDAKKKKKGKSQSAERITAKEHFFAERMKEGNTSNISLSIRIYNLIYEDYQSYIQNRSPSIIYFRRLITLSLSINQSLDLSFRVPAFILLRRFAII